MPALFLLPHFSERGRWQKIVTRNGGKPAKRFAFLPAGRYKTPRLPGAATRITPLCVATVRALLWHSPSLFPHAKTCVEVTEVMNHALLLCGSLRSTGALAFSFPAFSLICRRFAYCGHYPDTRAG